jgi:cell division protein FtsB
MDKGYIGRSPYRTERGLAKQLKEEAFKMKRFMVWVIALVFLFCTSAAIAAEKTADQKAADQKVTETKAAYDKAKAEKKAVDKKVKDAKKAKDRKAGAEAADKEAKAKMAAEQKNPMPSSGK